MTALLCHHMLDVAFHEFVEAIHAFQVTFPDSETQLVELAQDSVNKSFLVIEECVKTQIYAQDLLSVLRNGIQQICFLIRTSLLKQVVENEATMDFLLDEVVK
ncbi:hypothetical protein MTR_7g109490 [Medicago truncatula]|uniref:Uncharacterized protein n=1 Tax=Medicago truncatula TaxID=3880 RepID=G7KST4_MEDTR|nr:hypothetical protein MTR_7g109490 [Medicago truncatula]